MNKPERNFTRLILALALPLVSPWLLADPDPDSRPNILLIVADDLGYADLGIFGSDIRTPNIDGLAREGLRFSQFHTAPLCAPTRAMLLSGNNNHVAGMSRQGREGLLDYDVPGYEDSLSDRIAPFPRLLQASSWPPARARRSKAPRSRPILPATSSPLPPVPDSS